MATISDLQSWGLCFGTSEGYSNPKQWVQDYYVFRYSAIDMNTR